MKEIDISKSSRGLYARALYPENKKRSIDLEVDYTIFSNRVLEKTGECKISGDYGSLKLQVLYFNLIYNEKH